MTRHFILWLATCLLAAALAFAAQVAVAAQPSMGLTELPGQAGPGGEEPVTVFYPTAAPAQPIKRGVFTFDLAWQAVPTRGNGRLIVVSHGSGGAPWVHVDLARVLERWLRGGRAGAPRRHQPGHGRRRPRELEAAPRRGVARH